jgi:hypothetical protein
MRVFHRYTKAETFYIMNIRYILSSERTMCPARRSATTRFMKRVAQFILIVTATNPPQVV